MGFGERCDGLVAYFCLFSATILVSVEGISGKNRNCGCCLHLEGSFVTGNVSLVFSGWVFLVGFASFVVEKNEVYEVGFEA